MKDNYAIRRAESEDDAPKLKTLFSEVFHPEEVGTLAETMFHHLPGMELNYWFIAEEKGSGRIVSAFALIPWAWEMQGVKIKVAEMGIVGTLEEHRGQGLIRMLNQEFDQTLEVEGFDLAAIQGIPGFYDQFGYSYAVPLENHINLPLHAITEEERQGQCVFRLATVVDIPFLMAEDARYRASSALASFRGEAHWRYLLTHSQKTEYGSDFWIMERNRKAQQYYCRIPDQGFGSGLIVSEISQDMPFDALNDLFAFCKRLAGEREKPYIRLNLPNDSVAGRIAIAMGAKEGTPYAWQIKIPNPARFLGTIGPLLERRILASCFVNFSGVFRLDFFKKAIDLLWQNGRLESVALAAGESQYTLSLNTDLFPALILGHRTWPELRYIRPDISPRSEGSALFTETLFPSARSWIYEQY